MNNHTFYKYRSLSNLRWFLDIIVNQRLYMAHYSDMNDPMEGAFMYDKSASSMIGALKSGKQDMLICSLSKNYRNTLLWSHYAEYFHEDINIEPFEAGYMSQEDTTSFVDMSLSAEFNDIPNNVNVYNELDREYISNNFCIVHPRLDAPNQHIVFQDADRTVFDAPNCSQKGRDTIAFFHWNNLNAYRARVAAAAVKKTTFQSGTID